MSESQEKINDNFRKHFISIYKIIDKLVDRTALLLSRINTLEDRITSLENNIEVITCKGKKI